VLSVEHNIPPPFKKNSIYTLSDVIFVTRWTEWNNKVLQHGIHASCYYNLFIKFNFLKQTFMLLSSWRIKVVTVDQQCSYSLTCSVPNNKQIELFKNKIRFRNFIVSLNFPITFMAGSIASMSLFIMPFNIPLTPFRRNVNSHLAKIPNSSLTLFHADASSRETEAIMWHVHCHNTHALSVCQCSKLLFNRCQNLQLCLVVVAKRATVYPTK